MMKNLLKIFNNKEEHIQKIPSSCLNCKHLFSNSKMSFCPNCGQKRTFSKLKFSTLLKDFLEDYLLLDGKFLKSLIYLFFQPGQLTQQFNNGQRVRFIAPIRLFLFSGVLCFFILSWAVGNSNWKENMKFRNNGDNISMGFEELESQEEDNQPFLNLTVGDSTKYDLSKIGLLVLSMEDFTQKQAIDSLEVLIIELGGSPDKFEKHGVNLIKQFVKLVQSKGERLLEYFISQASLVILILQPIVALLLWLLFVRKRKQFFFLEHLVFSLHFHAFIYLIISTSLIIFGLKYWNLLFPLALLLSSIYLFFAFKKVYQQNIFKTLLKQGIFSFLYLLLIILSIGFSIGFSFLFF